MKRVTASFTIILILLFVLVWLNINSGSINISLSEIFDILSRTAEESTAYHIVWDIRLPRIIAALLLGGALSVSGFMLQTFFSNPIAGPYVLGISSGAKLTVALTMIFLLGKGIVISSWAMVVAAFAGSLISMGFVLAVSSKVKKRPDGFLITNCESAQSFVRLYQHLILADSTDSQPVQDNAYQWKTNGP